MADWRQGYYSELNHIPMHLREISPQYIDFALLRAGYKPPKSNEITYCDLGCGYGYNLIILAACYPEITFYGVDFNAEHIASAKSLIDAAQLKNIHLYDFTFEQFSKQDIPKFDYIVLNDIWSRVNQDVKQHIKQILFDNLGNNGAVYINYNTLPGASQQQPLRTLYKELYNKHAGQPENKIRSVLKFVDQLIDKNAAYFSETPHIQTLHERHSKQPAAYFAHEYLNETWQASYFSEISQMFEELNMTFATSAILDENGRQFDFDENYKELLDETLNDTEQQQIKDYVYNTSFRKDIFLRGKVKYNPIELEKELYQIQLALYGTYDNYPNEFEINNTTYNFDQDCHTQLIESLRRRPHSLGELRNVTHLENMDYKYFLHLISCAIEASQICLMRNVENMSIYSPETTARLNKAILQNITSDNEYQYLAAPEFGCGVKCSRIDQIFLKAIQDGDDLLSEKVKNLINQHKTLSETENNQLEDDKFLEEAAADFKHRKLQYIERYILAA